MSKATPGPWRFNSCWDDALFQSAYGAVIEVERGTCHAEDCDCVGTIVRVSDADAALIAAAPALADALEALLAVDDVAELVTPDFCTICCSETVGVAAHTADCPLALSRAALKAAGR